MLSSIASQLADVSGVVTVALGGSRARGTHRPDSDTDLGLYYRGDLDVEALRSLAHDITGRPTDVTAPGGWGPWVDGGGWLTVDGSRVDWIYRDLDRVQRVWSEARDGRYEIGFQPGHPLGFYSHAYAGEVALCRILADPTGELADMKRATATYPQALSTALVDGLWEADFCLQAARYGVAGNDPAYVAGSLFRAIGVACHALHGHDKAWLINEKGMVKATSRLPSAPPEFAARAASVVRTLDDVGVAEALVADVRAACGRS